MAPVRGVEPRLDLESYRRASGDLVTLSSKLQPETVEALAREVVTRLPLHIQARKPDAHSPGPEEIERLATALVSSDPDAGAAVIAEVRADGVSVADLYLLYLAEAARRLGEKWVADELSFAKVTVGTTRMLALLGALRKLMERAPPSQERLAVFASVPGEHHTIGITMAADLFRREGWEIQLVTGANHDEIVEDVTKSEARVVGLTAHGDRSIDALIRLILAIRAARPTTYILVSGKIVDIASDLIGLTGADALASDIPSGLVELERLHQAAHGG